MKIKLHDKNTSIVDLDLVIFVEKGEESIYIQFENHSFELDYSDLADDIEEVGIIDKDYQIITDCITTDVEKLKEVNEVLLKNLENNRNTYESLHQEFTKEIIKNQDYYQMYQNLRHYLLTHKFINKNQIFDILVKRN